PATAESAWSPQFQTTQLDRYAVYRIWRNLPVVGKQAYGGGALFLLIEDLQSLTPGCLLLVIDLTQIQDRSLYSAAAGHAAVFHEAEVAVVLAVLIAICAAQEHWKQQHARNPAACIEGRSSLCRFQQGCIAGARLPPRVLGKLP